MEIFGLHQPHNPESLSLELKTVTTTLMSIKEYATTTNLDTRMQFFLKSSGSPLCPNGILTIYICTATRIEATSEKNGRNGGFDQTHAYNGTALSYYLTPAEFFHPGEVNRDPADTARDTVGVLDQQGNVRYVYVCNHCDLCYFHKG